MRKTILMLAPFKHRSGFGEHARDIYNNLKDEYDIELLNLETYDPLISFDYKFPMMSELRKEYDMFLMVFTLDFLPAINIIMKSGIKFNKKVIVSAGIESYAVTPQWLDASKYYDFIITSSEHSKSTFISGGVEEGKLFVVPEGIDLKMFFEDKTEPVFNLPSDKKIILTAGQLGLGGVENDRKGIWLLVREFYKEFRNDLDVVLVAKVRQTNYNSADLYSIESRIKKLKGESKASVMLIHGELTTEEFRKLYSHPNIVACAYPTSGEGYGRHIIESAACKKPIIAPWKTGQKDFLLQDCIFELESNKGPVSDVYKQNMPIFFAPNSEWEIINPASLRKMLRKAVDEPFPIEKTEKQFKFIKKNHEIKKCIELFKRTIEQITSEKQANEEINE